MFSPPPLTKFVHTINKVTSTEWKGTGIQRLNNSNTVTIPDEMKHPTGATEALIKFPEALILNLKPQDPDNVCCQMYTPYFDYKSLINNRYIDWTTELNGEAAELECFWNPVRKTYQTVIPLKFATKVINSTSSAITVDRLNDILSETNVCVTLVQKIADGDISRCITWKFRKPTHFRLGICNGLYLSSEPSSLDNVGKFYLRSEADFRNCTHYCNHNEIAWLANLCASGTTTQVISSSQKYESLVCIQLLLLSLLVCNPSSDYAVDGSVVGDVIAIHLGAVADLDELL